jgi:DNA polymerase III sliding clamp (beta) subunit (PCNA family)
MLHTLNTFLPLAEKIYNKKSSIDILQFVCVTNESILFTDLETSIMMPVKDKRSFTLPIAILKKVLSTKPHSLHIEIPDKNKLRISYDNKQITFPIPSVEEYPSLALEDFKETAVWTKEVVHKLYKQIPYASKDCLRPALTGIFIQQNKKLSSVATDGHVLQWIADHDSDKKCELKSEFDCIVPVIAIGIVSRFNRGDVKVSLSDKYIRFTFNNNIKITSKLIKENYPDFKKVFPDSSGNEIIIEKKEILDCIKAALPFSNNDNHRAVFKSNNGFIQIKVEDSDEETSYESSFAVKNKKGNELTLVLNLQLLEKIIKGLDDDYLQWQYASSDDPSIFTSGNGIRNLLMPIRL